MSDDVVRRAIQNITEVRQEMGTRISPLTSIMLEAGEVLAAEVERLRDMVRSKGENYRDAQEAHDRAVQRAEHAEAELSDLREWARAMARMVETIPSERVLERIVGPWGKAQVDPLIDVDGLLARAEQAEARIAAALAKVAEIDKTCQHHEEDYYTGGLAAEITDLADDVRAALTAGQDAGTGEGT